MTPTILETKNVQVQTDPTPMDIYVARPDDGKIHPGVIVGFELFGLTPYIRHMADKIAELGYVSVVPDFFHRSGRSISLPTDEQGRKKGFELLDHLDRQMVLKDVGAALRFLRDTNRTGSQIGFVGFSIGGHMGFLAATEYNLQAVVAFYPGWLTVRDISLSRPQPTALLGSKISKDCKLLIIVGDEDALIPETVRQELSTLLKSQDVSFELDVYEDAQHGFMCNERPATYNPDASKLAWERVQEFLSSQMC